jgi:hypothetical protein
MDIPICANAVAEMASITSANNSERMEGMIRIMIPLCRSSLACPLALYRRGLRGWRGTIFQTKRTAHFVSLANASATTFSFRES